jgi:hypothetical protein
MFRSRTSSLVLFTFVSSVLLLISLTCVNPLFAQATPSVSSPADPKVASALEFPVTMRQNVIAGRTQVGTKIEAKLTTATLMIGVVIPAGAIFLGEIVGSSAKSESDPSRLGLRVDLVRWKNGSSPIKAYLTAWYYPLPPLESYEALTSHHPLGGPNSARHRADGEPQQTSENRTLLKDVESTCGADGAITLRSTHIDIKLDKATTYVLAARDLPTAK